MNAEWTSGLDPSIFFLFCFKKKSNRLDGW